MPEILKNISQVKLRMSRGAVVFGEVVYSPGGICGPRVQRDYQLVVIHRGTLDLRLDGEEISVAAGQAILLKPNRREHLLFTRDCETHHSWCAIRPSSVPLKLRRLIGSVHKPAPFDSDLGSLLKLGKAARPGSLGDETLEHAYYFGIGLSLFSGFATAALAGRTSQSPADEARAKLEEFVSREYEKPLKLANLAAAAGVSRQHLLKLFREQHWPTPTEFLYSKRLENAADMLAHTGLPIGEIASCCGFTNQFHFSRKFSRFYGNSPRAWRAQSWNG